MTTKPSPGATGPETLDLGVHSYGAPRVLSRNGFQNFWSGS